MEALPLPNNLPLDERPASREQAPTGDGAWTDSAGLLKPQRTSPQEIAQEARRLQAELVDRRLFDRITNDRDELAFSELMDRYSPRVYALLLHMLRAEEDAQDLLQEVFILIWNKAQDYYNSKGNVASWIITLARNRAVDEMRSKRYREKRMETEMRFESDRPAIADLIDSRSTPEAHLASKEAQLEIRIALKSLNEAQRTVIDLAYFGGMTCAEISEETGMPVSSVKTRLQQSMIKLARVVRPRM